MTEGPPPNFELYPSATDEQLEIAAANTDSDHYLDFVGSNPEHNRQRMLEALERMASKYTVQAFSHLKLHTPQKMKKQRWLNNAFQYNQIKDITPYGTRTFDMGTTYDDSMYHVKQISLRQTPPHDELIFELTYDQYGRVTELSIDSALRANSRLINLIQLEVIHQIPPGQVDDVRPTKRVLDQIAWRDVSYLSLSFSENRNAVFIDAYIGSTCLARLGYNALKDEFFDAPLNSRSFGTLPSVASADLIAMFDELLTVLPTSLPDVSKNPNDLR